MQRLAMPRCALSRCSTFARCKTIRAPLAPTDQERLEENLAPARDALTAESLAEAVSHGEAMSLEEAMTLLAEGLERHPDNADLLEACGWGLYRQGRAEDARNSLLKAKAAYGRYNHRLEEHLAAVMRAIANPGAAPAPRTAWLS